MIRILLMVFAILFSIQVYSQTTQSPEDYLGYTLGTRFTNHYKIVEYVRHIEQSKENVQLISYGETYEHRPLMVAVVSSAKNMAQLEEIRKSNLQRAGIVSGAPTKNVAIVWLSYNVHGNEASSSEAMMQTLYALSDKSNKEVQQWLENTVVILDPCINPDGRDRYVNFYNQSVSANSNPNLDTQEHNEVWPGGRQNHYLFDLNRDWAWQSQIESEQRIKLYNKWLPQVHVDYHEQYVENPYYFAPAAKPYHNAITPWQSDFQQLIGENHAKYFDNEGWLYFTKEFFDLLYPSYGDSYPVFNGAIGMTYEQAGHGQGGLQALLQNGDTLKLTDRVAHHYTTGLSTVEVASNNADKLVSEFQAYFKSTPKSKYKSYVITESNQAKVNNLTQLLDKQGITYGKVTADKKVVGFDFEKGIEASFTAPKGSLVVSTNQPKSILAAVLFEPRTFLEDSVTYDITAWSLPYALGFKAFASTTDIASAAWEPSVFVKNKPQSKAYAFVWEGNSVNAISLLTALQSKGINVRVSDEPFSTKEKQFSRGSFLVLKADNKHLKGYEKTVVDIANQKQIVVSTVQSGMVVQGKDFGSSSMRLLKQPKVGVVSGNGVSPTSFGEVWYYFDQVLEYQVSILRTDYLTQLDMRDYDVLVYPNGYYKKLDEDKLKELNRWVSEGGKLILMEGALRSFVDQEPFGLVTTHEETEEEVNEEDEASQKIYANRKRKGMEKYIPGAIYKTKLDNTHPLGFGYPNQYFTIKRSSKKYALLKNGWNVVVLSSGKPVSGFAGYKTQEELNNSLVMGVENIGAGSVVYFVDDPLFRAFWQSGFKLFANAVFLLP